MLLLSHSVERLLLAVSGNHSADSEQIIYEAPQVKAKPALYLLYCI